MSEMEESDRELCTAIDRVEDLTDIEKEDIKKWVKGGKSISILVMGKTGAGKSSLLNYFLGKSLFRVGKSKADHFTNEVSSRTTVKNMVKIVAWDSPGLQDGTSNEADYLKDMKAKCSDVDLVLYCISMEETRSDLTHHNTAISKITSYFGTRIWGNTLFVLTLANCCVDMLEEKGTQHLREEFEKQVQQWKEDIQRSLEKAGVDKKIVDNIKVVPAGHPKMLHLPGIKHWISNLWSECLISTKRKAQPALIKMETAGPEGGFVSNDEVNEESLKKATADERKIVFTPGVKVAIGATIGGVVATGAGIGAAIGGTIGALAIGIPSFGTAAVAGLGIGAAVGGAVGAGIATGVGALLYLWRRHKKKKIG